MVYTICFTLCLALLFIRSYWEKFDKFDVKKADKRNLYIMMFILFLLSALRADHVGADTNVYIAMFRNMVENGISKRTEVSGREVETGYYYFEYFVSLFTSNEHVFLGIISLIVTIVVSRFIKKYSINYSWSVFMYLILFFQFYGLTGCRQTLAGMILLISYDFVRKKKLFAFLISVALASTLHVSSILFLPMYFIADREITKNRIIFYIIVFVLTYVFRQQFLNLLTSGLTNITNDEYYLQYGNNKFNIRNFLLMIVALTAICLFPVKRVLKNNPDSKHYYNAVLFSLLLSSSGQIRVMMYYLIFIILLFPIVVDAQDKVNGMIMKYFIPLCMAILMLRSYLNYDAIRPYMFFWQ